MRSEKTIDLGGGCCSEETGRSTSRSAFVQVVGLLNTYLPLTVIVFVINLKWLRAAGEAASWVDLHTAGGPNAISRFFKPKAAKKAFCSMPVAASRSTAQAMSTSAPSHRSRLRQLSAQLAPAPAPVAAALSGGSGAMVPTDIMMGGIWFGPFSKTEPEMDNSPNADATIHAALRLGVRGASIQPSASMHNRFDQCRESVLPCQPKLLQL